MVYRIKEKFWLDGGEFSITNEVGIVCYYVKRQAFSFGIKISFKDIDQNKIGYIIQKLYSWEPRYEIVLGGASFGEVTRDNRFFNIIKKYKLDGAASANYTVKGSFWQHELEFISNDIIVADVSKSRWSWADSYGVDIIDSKNHLVILSTCLIIDQIEHDFKK